MEQIPRVLPWAFVFWPFFLHFVLKASKLERRPSVCCEQGEWGGANLMLLVPFDNVLPDFESGSIEYKDLKSSYSAQADNISA